MIDLNPKRVRMIVMIDDYANITPKAWVYCKGLVFNKKTRSINIERTDFHYIFVSNIIYSILQNTCKKAVLSQSLSSN